jgi:predicted nucleic acid-binding protein
VLFAGSASPNEYSASMVILRMAEITLIDALTSEQVIAEVKRNLEKKMPAALPAFLLLVSRCLRVVPDPTTDEIEALANSADAKDLPILAAAVREGCAYLTTYNIRHFQPGVDSIQVLKPGDLVQRVRYLLAQLS